MALLAVLGFASGLPLYLTSQTLQAWLTSEDIDHGAIANLSLVGLAYTLKFAWAPLLDRYTLPVFGRLGRRRGWVVALQILLVVAIGTMGMLDPKTQLAPFVVLAVAVAFLSASQDVVLDAYNADILAPAERAAGAAVYVLGYRAAMVLSGTLALALADYVSWTLIYGAMAGLMACSIGGILLADEPPAVAQPPTTLAAAVYLPFVEMYRRLGASTLGLVLAFTAVFKFGDYFAQALVITFLARGPGFDFTEIAAVYKVLGFAGTAIGGLCAGAFVARFGMPRMLVAFGLLQATTNLLYALLALTGKSFPVFCAAVLVDNLANAMGTATFVALLMSVCSPAVSATQFALLTSLSSVGQRVFGPFAGDVVDAAGWAGFFLTTTLMAIPGLLIAAIVGRRFDARRL
ncbi:MAG: AmpG family muropeptide MFS transporter [Kofleriaceae bacterium]